MKSSALTKRASALAILLCGILRLPANAQAGGDSGTTTELSDSSVHRLSSQVSELRALVEQMRTENVQSRAEMRELREQLLATQKLLAPQKTAEALSLHSESSVTSAQDSALTETPQTVSSAEDLNRRVQSLEDSTQLLGSKVDEQYQTKVESAARYRARLSGIILMNAFRNAGNSDNLDVPNYAQPIEPGRPVASLGATLRQSQIGLEIFGPTLAGAKTSANVQFDFAGGFAATPNGVNFGTARLQTASLRLDWQSSSIIAGQDSLFFSPLSPTSFASLSTPAFAYAGNLWGWTPQLRIEHNFELRNDQHLSVQAGVLDSLDWTPPSDPYFRSATTGESSGQPAYAVRTAWSRPVLSKTLTIAAAGYYGRQNWYFGRSVDSWAALADWRIPLFRRLTLSGEFFRGRGVGTLGAGVGRAVLFGGNPSNSASPVRGLDSAGGWSELKFQLTPKIELNGTFAEDTAFASDVRGFATDANNFDTIIGRNRGALGNVVYRPRSDLLLSAEFRRLRTSPIYSGASGTNQLNLAMGILF